MFQKNHWVIINKKINKETIYLLCSWSLYLYPADLQNDDLGQVTTKDTQTIEMFRQG